MSPRRTIKPEPALIDWLTLLQFGLGALAICVTLGAAVFSLTGALVVQVDTGAALAEFILAASYFALSLLLIPSTFYSLQHILGMQSKSFRSAGSRFAVAVLLVPLILLAGVWATERDLQPLILLTHLATTVLTVAWLAWVALRGIQLGSSQRGWGAFGSGLAATPLLALLVEGLALIFAGVIAVAYIQANPELQGTLDVFSATTTPEDVFLALNTLTRDPVLFIGAFLGLSVFVPIVEELLKPIGVYLLLGRNLTNAQGFALGALCGAGYAIAETLLGNSTPELLLVGGVGRFGTTAMHIFTAALSGYGLARARNEGNWLLAPLFLLGSMVIHGLWNASVVFVVAASLNMTELSLEMAPVALGGICVLGLLAAGSILFLHVFNRRLVAARPS